MPIHDCSRPTTFKKPAQISSTQLQACQTFLLSRSKVKYAVCTSHLLPTISYSPIIPLNRRLLGWDMSPLSIWVPPVRIKGF